MFESSFYHQHIRNSIVGFGNLFSKIKIQRMNNGVVEQTIAVPIAYAQKDKWVQSIDQNPNGDGQTYASIPRLAFEVLGYSYDSQRKINRQNKISCVFEDGRKATFAPSPWNIDLALYFATKNQEDGLQILEQILPAFNPEFTIQVKTIPSLNIVSDVPIILNSVTVQDDYEGDLEMRRFVVHTLTFQAKLNLFAGIADVGVIKHVDVDIETNSSIKYVADQEVKAGPISEEWMNNF